MNIAPCAVRNADPIRSRKPAGPVPLFRRIDWNLRIFAACLMLTLLLPAFAGAANEGCADATVSVQVQSEDDSSSYYVVSTTVNPDARAKKQKAERVTLVVDAKLAVEGVDRSGVPYREEVPLEFRLTGVRFGTYSRTVKGDIRGPRVNRHILGVTIQQITCQWQEPNDENEDSTVS